MIVLAPATVQEAVDMTYEAFDLAQRDRNPVLILADGVLGTIMEPVELPPMRTEEEVRELREAAKDWALSGHPAEEKKLTLPGGWRGQEERCKANAAMYETWEFRPRGEVSGPPAEEGRLPGGNDPAADSITFSIQEF